MAQASAKTPSPQKLSSTTKVAAIMIALGVDSASEVYKYLREDEIEEKSVRSTALPIPYGPDKQD